MPIKGLTDRGLSFPEIGSIRKGKKITKERKDGSKYEVPVDLKYFRVLFDEQEIDSAQLFLDTYGEEPDQINIILPFNEIERCWDANLEAYTAGRMVARSDGEIFTYLIDTDTGEILVRNGEPRSPYIDGQQVGKDSKGKAVYCRPVGRLKVIIPELARLAFLTVNTTSIHDIHNISSQLAGFKELNNGVIKGVPLVIRRRPRPISIPKKDGTRIRMEKWLISIEADPAWVKAKLAEVKHLSFPDIVPLLTGEDDSVIESEFLDDEEDDEILVESSEEIEVSQDESEEIDEPKEEKNSDPGPGEEGGEVDIYQGVVDAGLSPNLKDAKIALGRCKIGYETQAKANEWMRKYNSWLELGASPAQAAKNANEGNEAK